MNKVDEEIYVANLVYERGEVFRCLVWDENEKPIDLSRYINNLMDLKKQHEFIHVQNPYTSIIIETKDVVDIVINTIKKEEW